MAEMESISGVQSESMQFVKESHKMGMDVAAPYKQIIKWMLIAFVIILIAVNAAWAIVMNNHINKAYEPTEMEITQMQDIPSQTQSQAQTTKGVN